MMISLIRKDPTFRWVLLMVPIAFFITWLYSSSIGVPPDDRAIIRASTVLGSVILLCLIILLIRRKHDYLSELELSLPLPVTTWVRARAVVLLSLGCVPIALSTALMYLIATSPAVEQRVLVTGASSTVSWGALIALRYGLTPSRPSVSSALYAAILLVGLGLLVLSGLAPWVGLALASPILVLASLSMILRTPAQMSLAGDQVIDAPPRGRNPRWRSLSLWLARRTFLTGSSLVQLIVMMPMLVFLFDFSSVYIMVLIIAAINSKDFVIRTSRVLGEVGHLPVPRSKIAPYVLLPCLVVLLLCVLLQAPAFTLMNSIWSTSNYPTIRVRADDSSTLSVPMRMWLFTWSSEESYVVESPSGESASLNGIPLFDGSPVALINPYDISSSSSSEFVAWQLSRSMDLAVGIETAPEEIREYLQLREGRVERFDEYRFVESHTVGRISNPPGLMYVNMLLVILVWLGSSLFSLGWSAPPGNKMSWWFRLTLSIAMIGVIALIPFFDIWLFDHGYDAFGTMFTLGGLFCALGNTLDHATGGRPWLSLPLLLALVAASYWALSYRFKRFEPPHSLIKGIAR